MARERSRVGEVPGQAWGQRSKDLVIVLALIGAGFVLGWLRLRPQLASAQNFRAGQASLAAGDPALRYAAWQPRGALPGPAESGAERAPTVSPDGRFVVFQVGERGRGADLFVAPLERGPEGLCRGPSAPLPGPFGPADELAPAFVGPWLYFASDRPGGAGGFDLYRVRFDSGVAGEIVHLPAPWNSPADELDPSGFGAEGLLFASTRHDPRGRDHDLYLGLFPVGGEGDPAAAALQRLEDLASPYDEREPRLAAGGQALWFASDRPGGAGGFDLYRALEQGGRFVEPAPVAALCGPGSERAPWPLGRGFELLFDQASAVGEPRLMWAESDELFAQPGAPPAWRELLALGLLLLLALLAFLAKRWRAMDVVYRCYVVSLLVHLLLLWGAGGLRSADGRSGGSRRERVSVRLVAPGLAALEARGGELGLARAAASAARGSAPRRAIEAADPPGGARSLPAAAPLDPLPPPESSSVALAPQQASPRSKSSPAELELRPEALEPRRASAAGPAPAPAAGVPVAQAAGQRARPSSPSSVPARRALIGAPDSESPSGPARPELAPAPLGPPAEGPAAAAAERLEPQLARGSASRAQALELSAPDPAQGPDPAGASAERSARAETGSSWTALAGAATSQRRDADRPRAPGPRLAAGARAEPALEPAAPAPLAPLGADGAAPLAPVALPAAIAGAPAEPRFAGRGGLERALESPLAAAGPAPGSESELGIGSAAEAAAASGPPAAQASLLGSASPAAVGPRRFERRAPLAKPSRGFLPSSAEPELPAAQAPLLAAAPVREVPGPARDGSGDWSGTPFQARSGAARAAALSAFGGDQQTEDAVARGLAYLARIQDPGGFWGDGERFDPKYGYVCVGNTGLALLAFLGAGHTPAGGGPYADHVARAIDFLLAVQGQRSGHFGDTGPYSHAIATYALAEAYALERDARLRAPIEAAVAHLLAAQDRRSDPRRLGGWGYFYPSLEPGERGDDGWPRTSVSAWCVMALESARLGGIEVPAAALAAARGFFERAFDPRLGAFRYSHDPQRLGSAWPTLPASTPAALFVLGLFGADLEARELAPARDFIQRRAPLRHARASDDAFVRRGEGNLYFIYYATLASFRIGGGAWERWNAALKDTLLPAQRPDGSWEPICTYALDYAGDSRERSVYTTALAVLSLEVYYRYFTPLLRVEPGDRRSPSNPASGANTAPAAGQRRDL